MKAAVRLAAMTVSVALTAVLAGCGGSENGTTGTQSAKLLAQVIVSSGTATFSGTRNNYTVTRTSSGVTVVDKTGVDGTSNLSNVQTLKFTDVSVNLSVGDKSKTIAADDLKLLTELYVAFFNRVPDADGLSYWIDQFKGGRSIDLIAESFYDAAIQSSSITGYTSTMTNADFVKIIYKNVLGRSGTTAPPDSDVAYWAGELTNGNKTRGSLIKFMLGSAHSFKGDATWGWVADLLDNKYTVATFVAMKQGLNYNTPDESITKGMAIAAAVTSTDTTAAISVVGMTDTAFDLTVAAPSGPSFSQVQAIVTQRCTVCHATQPTQPGYNTPPAGVVFETESQIRSYASTIYQVAVQSRSMPFGNATGMTDDERTLIGQWFTAGAQ
jgi:cytochrome c5